MDKNFKVNEAPAKQPVVFDHLFAEKVGGGLVKNASYDRHPGLAVSVDGVCLKAAVLVEDADYDATSIKVKKGSGLVVGDCIATGSVAVAISAVDSSHDDYDILTIAAFGVDLDEGDIVFQATAATRAAGYDDCESADDGALKVVSDSATTGQINLAEATPYYGSKTLAANDYVKAVPKVDMTPKVAPAFVLGTFLPADCGDEVAKLVNGANIRKENALFPAQIADMMKGIHLI